jgi:hypothetical protein
VIRRIHIPERDFVALSILGDGLEAQADPAVIELDPATALMLGADLRLLANLAR